MYFRMLIGSGAALLLAGLVLEDWHVADYIPLVVCPLVVTLAVFAALNDALTEVKTTAVILIQIVTAVTAGIYTMAGGHWIVLLAGILIWSGGMLVGVGVSKIPTAISP